MTRDEIIVRANVMLRPYDMEELRRSILKQAESGVIVIPRYCEILHPNEMILEKIREEIEREMSVMPNEFNQHDESDYDRGLFKALQIIDKCTKGEPNEHD